MYCKLFVFFCSHRRSKKKCPQCSQLFGNLPLHMREEHNWTQPSSQNVSAMFGLRKNVETSTEKKKYRHYLKICPFEECYSVTKNPGEHLRSKKHGMKTTDPDYKSTIKLFKRYDPSLLECVTITESPKKRYGVINKKNTTARKQNSSLLSQIPIEEQSTIIDEQNSRSGSGDESGFFPLGPTVNKLITEFHKYMVGPNRGRKTRSVQGVVYDVRRALKIIGIRDDLSSMFEDDDEGLLTFIDHYEKKKALPGSIKKYISSLRDFIKFLIQSRSHEFSVTKMIQTDTKLEQWRKNYRRRDRLQSHKRKADDRLMLIDKNQVATYDASAHKQQKRSGVVVNMTMEEYKGKSTIGNQHHIPVWNHKTVETYGPAPVLLKQDLFQRLKVFVQIIRPKLIVICSDAVFLSWAGHQMQSSDPSKRLHAMWERSGNFQGRNLPKNLTMNHIRKSVSTAARKQKNSYTKEIAITMAHSEKTASTHYDIYEQEKASAKGAEEIQREPKKFNHFSGTRLLQLGENNGRKKKKKLY